MARSVEEYMSDLPSVSKIEDLAGKKKKKLSRRRAMLLLRKRMAEMREATEEID